MGGGQGAAVAADGGGGHGIGGVLLGNVSGYSPAWTVAPCVGVVAAAAAHIQYSVEGDGVGAAAIDSRRLGDFKRGAGNLHGDAHCLGAVLAVGNAQRVGGGGHRRGGGSGRVGGAEARGRCPLVGVAVTAASCNGGMEGDALTLAQQRRLWGDIHHRLVAGLAGLDADVVNSRWRHGLYRTVVVPHEVETLDLS